MGRGALCAGGHGKLRENIIRDNPVKAALAGGGRAFGAMIFELFSPGLPQICKNAGADFILYDMEHTGLGLESLKTQFAICRGLGLTPMVRVPRGEYHFIARALDVGAMGIMVPMVGSAEEAAHIVSCTRYPPLGKRGAAFGFAHDDYQGGDVAQKIAALHARTMVIPQIETTEGLANVEAIAAVDGVDALWVGHFDLTNFMGIPGQFQHPDYLSGIARVVGACESRGKSAAFLAADDGWAREYVARGFRLMAYGIDQLMLQAALKSGLDLLRAAK